MVFSFPEALFILGECPAGIHHGPSSCLAALCWVTAAELLAMGTGAPSLPHGGAWGQAGIVPSPTWRVTQPSPERRDLSSAAGNLGTHRELKEFREMGANRIDPRQPKATQGCHGGVGALRETKGFPKDLD